MTFCCACQAKYRHRPLRASWSGVQYRFHKPRQTVGRYQMYNMALPALWSSPYVQPMIKNATWRWQLAHTVTAIVLCLLICVFVTIIMSPVVCHVKLLTIKKSASSETGIFRYRTLVRFLVQSRLQSTDIVQTDRQIVMHMSPPCKLHRWAQKKSMQKYSAWSGAVYCRYRDTPRMQHWTQYTKWILDNSTSRLIRICYWMPKEIICHTVHSHHMKNMVRSWRFMLMISNDFLISKPALYNAQFLRVLTNWGDAIRKSGE